MKNYLLSVKREWRSICATKPANIILVAGLVIIITLISLLPGFYSFVEQRTGTQIHDKLLYLLPSVNVSLPIFIIIWATVILFIIRSLRQPTIFISMLVSYIIFLSIRYLVIYMVPLEPPVGLLELKDPFTDVFYGGYFVTKDLFFSGHVGSEVLFLLVMTSKRDKFILSIAAFVLAFLLLLQHVHYTIDILAAPFFSLLSYLAAEKILMKAGIFKVSSLQADLPIRFGKA